MSDDASKSLELKIVTKADLAGAKAAETQLESTIAKAKFLGKAYADEEAQLNRVRAALKEFEKAHGEAGEAAKPFEHEMGEVKKSIRELNEQFPLAARALQILTNPVGGALALGIAMFGYFKEKLDEWNKEMDETTETLRKPDFEDAIKAKKEVLEQAEVAMAQYADKMAHLIDPEEHYQKLIQSQIALLQARNAAANTVADARNGLDEAELKQANELAQAALLAQLEAGIISQEKYLAEKLRLDSKYYDDLTQLEIAHEQAKLQREKALRDEIVKIEEGALAHAKEQQPKLDKAAQDTRAKAVAAAAHVASQEGTLTSEQAHTEDRQKEVDDAEKAIKSAYNMTVEQLRALDAAKGSYLQKQLVQERLRRYDTAVDVRDKGQQNIRKLIPEVGEDKVDAALTQAGADRAETAAEANAKRIQDQSDALAAEKTRNKAADDAGAAAGAAKTDAARLKERGDLDKLGVGGGYTGADLENIAALERIKALGGPLSDGQRKQIEAFEKFAASVNVNVNELTQLMFTAVGTMATQTQQIAALRKEIELLTKRQADLPNR